MGNRSKRIEKRFRPGIGTWNWHSELPIFRMNERFVLYFLPMRAFRADSTVTRVHPRVFPYEVVDR